MEKTSFEVDFRQLLEDVARTNRIMKAFDMGGTITRNQYYQLKDAIVRWLVRHGFTRTAVDGTEYLVGRTGERIELVRLTITYGDTRCVLHQNIGNKTRKALGFNPEKPATIRYEPAGCGDKEPDTDTVSEFTGALSRMKAVRLAFLRNTLDTKGFEHAYMNNLRSCDPWMKKYRRLLPESGRVDIEIVDKQA